jgi:hypothetical protein
VTLPIPEPNEALGLQMLADGEDISMLVSHCGFASLHAARQFANQYRTQETVHRLWRERAARIGIKAMKRVEAILDDQTCDKRSAVAAARTGLDLAGLSGKPMMPPVRRVEELSVAELTELIEATRRELEESKRKRLVSCSRGASKA